MVSKSAKLRQSVHEILIRDWDPIGIGHIPACEDEYDNYISGIIRLLRTGADVRKIAKHLTRLEAESMGRSTPHLERNQLVAEKLCALQT